MTSHFIHRRGGASSATLTAQCANVLTSLAVFVIATRALSTAQFAKYSALMGLYAIGNAAVGTAFGTSGLAAVARGERRNIPIPPRAASGGLFAAGALMAAACAFLKLDLTESLLAVASLTPWFAAELASGFALGHRRYWQYAGVVAGRGAVWTVASAGLVAVAPAHWRLGGLLTALCLSAVVPVVYLIRVRGVTIARHSPEAGVTILPMSITQVGLWLVASADRVVFAHMNPAGAALYAADYGVLDRAFRTVANSELSRRLPILFSARGAGRTRLRAIEVAAIAGFVAVAVAGAPPAVDVLSGGKYRPGYILTSLLAVAMGLMLAAVPAFGAALADGFAKTIAPVALAIGLGNALANLFVIPRFGRDGAATVTLVSYVMWLTAVLYLPRRGLGRSPAGAAGVPALGRAAALDPVGPRGIEFESELGKHATAIRALERMSDA